MLVFFFVPKLARTKYSDSTSHRPEMAHPQEDDHTNLPLQYPAELCGSVLREERDPGQQVAEGSWIPAL